MDPFSITAGAIGITGFATTSIVQLHSLISGLSEAQDLVTDIASSLSNIQRPLAALEQLSISDESTSVAAKEYLKKAGVAEAVNECGNAYNGFNKSLTKWTKHSSTAKLSLRDRLSVGVWNREKIRTLTMQVRSKRSGQEISIIITLDNPEAMVGLLESVVGKINQRITDVRTEGGSVAVVGVYINNIDLEDL